MKKLILIPTILASATPLVCMVACNPSKPVMSITGGEQKQVVARERRIGDKNAIVATFPGFTAKNVTLSNLTLEVKTDAWVPIGEIQYELIPEVQNGSSHAFGIHFWMIDDSQIQLGDVYVLSFKISCGKDVLFNSNEYSVLLKEVINQPSEDEKRIGTLEYYQETLPEISYYYTMIEGFSSIRCFYGRSSIGEYVVKIYDPESMQEMTEFTGYFSVDNDVSGDHIEIDTNENLTQDSIQFKIGIYRDSVGFDEYYTILDPQESEIYTLNKYSE